jgi:hypothetical protein
MDLRISDTRFVNIESQIKNPVHQGKTTISCSIQQSTSDEKATSMVLVKNGMSIRMSA